MLGDSGFRCPTFLATLALGVLPFGNSCFVCINFWWLWNCVSKFLYTSAFGVQIFGDSGFGQGWNFALQFFKPIAFFLSERAVLSWKIANHSRSLVCNDWWEQVAYGHSFVKNNESEALLFLFKKERLSKERQERFNLGHKKGESTEKLSRNIWKIQSCTNCSFFESDLHES